MTPATPRENASGNVRSRERRALIVMARAPRLGTVKTRLAREIGDVAALGAYRELAEGVLGSLRGVEAVRVLQYTPPDAIEEMRDWARSDWQLAPQCDGSLGDRMTNAAAALFAGGAARVVIVGTDCPAVDERVVEDAFAALDDDDVVFGPAHDGGYYLVGMRDGATLDLARLFAGVPWSTRATLATNVERAEELGLSVAMLTTHRDVDSREDLEHWRAHRIAPPALRRGRHA